MFVQALTLASCWEPHEIFILKSETVLFSCISFWTQKWPRPTGKPPLFYENHTVSVVRCLILVWSNWGFQCVILKAVKSSIYSCNRSDFFLVGFYFGLEPVNNEVFMWMGRSVFSPTKISIHDFTYLKNICQILPLKAQNTVSPQSAGGSIFLWVVPVNQSMGAKFYRKSSALLNELQKTSAC